MNVRQTQLFRLSAVAGLFAIATAFSLGTPHREASTVPGMNFKLRVVLKHTPTTGRAPRAVTLQGRGQFGAGMGRVDIDSIDAPSAFRKGDFIIIRDSMNSFWARPADLHVRRINSVLVNPLEGISERLSSGTGAPSELKVDFDTVSLDEMVNGMPTRHFRITADASYPIGNRQATQKVVIEQWLAKVPVRIVNPFGSRIRGLPDLPTTKGDYRAFLNTLAAANRVFGEAVAVRTLTTTSWVYGPGLGEDYYQTVDITDLQPGEIDDKTFQLTAEYKLQATPRDTMSGRSPTVVPKKPPTT